MLLGELERALGYPKLRAHISADDADQALLWVRQAATIVEDALSEPTVRSTDPGDDYLIALAAGESCALVSGDKHLQVLGGQLPIYSPRDFLDRLPV